MNWLDWLKNLFGKPPPAPAPKPRPLPPPAPEPTPAESLARLIALHNTYRVSKGLSALETKSSLMLAAQTHATDNFVHRVLNHTGSDGSDPGTRITRAGYAWVAEAENIEAGLTTPEAVMSSWLASPLHLANIRGPYRNIGAGRAGNYWCVTLASPK